MTWVWSKRVILCNRHTMMLRKKKKKFMQIIRPPGSMPDDRTLVIWTDFPSPPSRLDDSVRERRLGIRIKISYQTWLNFLRWWCPWQRNGKFYTSLSYFCEGTEANIQVGYKFGLQKWSKCRCRDCRYISRD